MVLLRDYLVLLPSVQRLVSGITSRLLVSGITWRLVSGIASRLLGVAPSVPRLCICLGVAYVLV